MENSLQRGLSHEKIEEDIAGVEDVLRNFLNENAY